MFRTIFLATLFLCNAWVAGAQWYAKVNAGAGLFYQPYLDPNQLPSLSAIEGRRLINDAYKVSNFLQLAGGRITSKGRLIEVAFYHHARDWAQLTLNDRTNTPVGDYRERNGELLLEYGWQRPPRPEKKRRTYFTLFSGFRYSKTVLRGALPGVYNQYSEHGKMRIGIGTKLHLPMGKRVFWDLNTGIAFWSFGLEELYLQDPDVPGGITVRLTSSEYTLETHARVGLGVRLGKIKRANAELIETH